MKCVLIDLDHTLCSTEHGVEVALRQFANQYNVQNLNGLKKQFSRINKKLFKKYLVGRFEIDEFRLRRYEHLLGLPGITIKCASSPEEEATTFTETMNRNCELFEDTISFLEFLRSKNVQIGLLTNGPSDGQRTKLETLGISDYFDEIFISGETGYDKPNSNAFTNALSKMQVSPGDSMMIGDNLDYDVFPALNLGMHAVFLNRSGHHPKINSSITVVHSLKVLQVENMFE